MDKTGLTAKNWARLFALGLFSGVINGLFGSGGGVAIVLCLWYLARGELRDRREVFANVTAIILPVSLASSLVYLHMSPPRLSEAIPVGIAALVGGGVGGLLLGRLNVSALKRIFALLLLVSGLVMIFL